LIFGLGKLLRILISLGILVHSVPAFSAKAKKAKKTQCITENLSSTFRRELTQIEKTLASLKATSLLPLPKQAKELIGKHGIRKLSSSHRKGKGILFQVNYYHPDGSLAPGRYGESIQSHMVVQTLQEVFPEARFGGGQDGIYLATRPGEKVVSLDILDHAEGGWIGRPRPTDLNMVVLKPANPVLQAISRADSRAPFEIPENKFAVSVYLQQSNIFPEARAPGWEVGGRDNPNFAEILSAIRNVKEPDVVFLSTGGVELASIPPDIAAVERGYNVVLLSQWNAYKMGDKPTIVMNNYSGILPYLYAASDLAVISGPVNIFEPLTVGTKTVFFENSAILADYNPNAFGRLSKVAQETGGGYSARNLEDMEFKIFSALLPGRPITPPYRVEDQAGTSAFSRYLDHLQRAVENGLKRAKPARVKP
jgi:hypothetical protein